MLRENLSDKWQIDLLVEQRAFNGAQEFFSEANLVNEIKVFDFKGKFAFLKIFALLQKISGYQTIISSGSSPLVSLLLFFSGASRRIGFASKFSFLLTAAIKLNKKQYAAKMLADLVKPLVSTFQEESFVPQLVINSTQNPVSELQAAKYFLIHPGVSKLGLAKNFIKSPNADYWSELIQQLFTNYPDHKIVLVGGPDDIEIVEQISKLLPENKQLLNLSETKFKLLELASLIKESQVFICADSAPLHLAVSVNAKTAALFGPTDPEKIVPKVNNLKVVQVPGLLCQPCLWSKRSQSCALPLCVSYQQSEAVLKAISQLLGIPALLKVE